MSEKLKFVIPFSILPFSRGIFFGIIFGYFLSKFYTEKIAKKGFFPASIYLPLWKSYSLKLHHWLYPLFILSLILIFRPTKLFHPLFLGTLGGIAYHDFVTDSQWKKLIYKKEKNGSNRKFN